MISNNERRTKTTKSTAGRRKVTVRSASQAVAAGALLISGAIWAGTLTPTAYAKPGELLLPGAVVQPALAPKARPHASRLASLVGDVTPDITAPVTGRIAQVLRKYAKDDRVADRAAAALVRESRKHNMDPVLLVGLMITENAKIDPAAKSNVGATGLMQVMPFHAGEYDCGSNNLINVESNICHGVTILAMYMKKSPKNMHKALLRYNGCVRGTNTPNCHTYSSKVYKYANDASRMMVSMGGDGRRFVMPSVPATKRAVKSRTSGRSKASASRSARSKAGTSRSRTTTRKAVVGKIRRTG